MAARGQWATHTGTLVRNDECMMTNSSELSFLRVTVCENDLVMIWPQNFFSLEFYKEIIEK